MAIQFSELDVRPLLEGSGEPFPAIMAAVDALSPGEGLLLIAPFRPVPLFKVMERKGFRHEVTEIADGSFEVRFIPMGADVRVSHDVADDDVWPEPSRAFDLSDLDPPEPMVRILAELETMAPGEVLFAVLSREPVFLFGELSARGHKWAGNHDKTGEAFRILVKCGARAE